MLLSTNNLSRGGLTILEFQYVTYPGVLPLEGIRPPIVKANDDLRVMVA